MAYTFKHGDRPIEGYTIQRAVGKGGFGEVYYAVSDGGREVALKYLRDNPQVELRGVSNCINLKSPYLVSIFDVKKTTDGEYAIIMEYCSGPSLRDLLIAEPGGFGPQKATFFVREIAKGLSYLHDRGIVHRDLKPGNIFYDDGYVKIGDYGLSKFISISRHSGQTASVGTVHYMAPEIGSGNYSKGVDIYALGVMLYEMLLGQVPFEGSTMAEVLMKHLTTQPEVDHLPHPFAEVIRKALQKDPNDRYQTVDEMVEQLLEVETVRESLAGFSPQSLDGAVHRGAADRADSPMPSPNPIPGYARDFAGPARDAHGQPPYAKPVGADGALPHRLAKKMQRISQKVDARVAKLAGRSASPSPPPPPTPTPIGQPGSTPAMPGITRSDRKKRILLTGLLSIGLAIGLGVLVGNTCGCEEVGAGAGLLVVTMSGGILLSRSAVRWFGVAYGPSWPQRLIQLCCCAPLIALGAAPIMESRYGDEGVALYLGLLVVAVFFREGEKHRKGGRHRATAGELSFGCALWTALWALICTAIAGGILDADVYEQFIFVAAGVAGAASLIIQATSWWLPAHTTRAFQHGGAEPQADWKAGREAPPLPKEGEYAPGAEAAGQQPVGDPLAPTDEAYAHHGHHGMGATPLGHRRLRWGITRAFWGLVAFAMMGGAVATFLISLIGDSFYHDEITGAVAGCTGFASFMLFALRKTTPVKRDGFWRETLRPFLIALTMFGIGGMITLIAREWSACDGCGGLDDQGRIGVITGLVMFSLLFLGLTLFTGRRRRAPRPFVLGGKGSEGTVDVTMPDTEVSQEEEPSESLSEPGGQPENPAARAVSAEGLRPHRGVTVLVLGILGIINLFPLGIIAWVMGHRDLLAMDAGRMDPSGWGITSAGKICGMISVVIASLGLIGGLTVAILAVAGVIH